MDDEDGATMRTVGGDVATATFGAVTVKVLEPQRKLHAQISNDMLYNDDVVDNRRRVCGHSKDIRAGPSTDISLDRSIATTIEFDELLIMAIRNLMLCTFQSTS
jgi:hypothetical protein